MQLLSKCTCPQQIKKKTQEKTELSKKKNTHKKARSTSENVIFSFHHHDQFESQL